MLLLTSVLLIAGLAVGPAQALDPPRRPIYFTINIHGHNFSDTIPPENSEETYIRHRNEVVWLLQNANSHGAKLSFQMAGEYAEWADHLVDFAHISDYLNSGHSIGAHFHNEIRTGTRTWQKQISTPPPVIDQLWQDNLVWVERAVRAVSPTFECHRIDPANPLWFEPARSTLLAIHDGWIEAAPEDHITGFEGFTKFAHHVWNPYRRRSGELLEEDLGNRQFVDLPFYPQIGGELEGGGTMGRHAGFIATVDHLKRHILMTYVEWLAHGRSGKTDRIWTVGWVTHPDQGTRHRTEIEEMMDWMDGLLLDTETRHGSPIFKYATDMEVYQNYLEWETEHPGESHFSYEVGEPYPYSFPAMGQILEPYAYKQEIDMGTGPVQVHELVWGATADIAGATSLYWAWTTDGTQTIDLSGYLNGMAEVRDGYGGLLVTTPDDIRVGHSPAFVREATGAAPTATPTPCPCDVVGGPPPAPNPRCDAYDLLAILEDQLHQRALDTDLNADSREDGLDLFLFSAGWYRMP